MSNHKKRKENLEKALTTWERVRAARTFQQKFSGRVELNPVTDLWMQGDKFGEITYAVLRKEGPVYYVLMDVSKREYQLSERDIWREVR